MNTNKINQDDMKKSVWRNFKNYINDLPHGEIFYRQDLIKNTYAKPTQHIYGRYVSVDVYKRCAELNGIISVLGRGIYMKLHDIPEDCSSVDFKTRAYDAPIYSRGSIMDICDQL